MNSTEISNLILRANALVKTNWLHAVHILEQAKTENPQNLSILMNLGNVFLERQLFEKALGYFQEAIALKPDDPQLLYIIGNCYFSTGEYRIANSYFNQIKDPPPEVLYNKALSLAFLGMNKESIEVINQLLLILTDNPFIYFLLIEQHLRIQNYELAHQIIVKSKKLFGKHRQLLLLSAIVNSKKCIWLQAYHDFAEYEALSPINNPDHLVAFAQAAYKIGLGDRSINLLNRALKQNPYISSAYEELIRIQLQKSDFAGARKTIKLAKQYITRFNPILKLLQERVHNEAPI